MSCLNPFFLVESPDGFWPPCFLPSFFLFTLSFLCFSFSTLSGTLCFLPVFVSQMYLAINVLNYSDHSAAFCLSSQVTTIWNLNWVKDILSWDFLGCYTVYLMLCLHDILTSCQHIISLLILSAVYFFKKIINRTDKLLFLAHQCTEPDSMEDDFLPLLYSAPNSGSDPCMAQRGDSQSSPKWEPDYDPCIMDKETCKSFFLFESVSLFPLWIACNWVPGRVTPLPL